MTVKGYQLINIECDNCHTRIFNLDFKTYRSMCESDGWHISCKRGDIDLCPKCNEVRNRKDFKEGLEG